MEHPSGARIRGTTAPRAARAQIERGENMSVQTSEHHTHESHVWLHMPGLRTSLSHIEAFAREVRRVGGTDATEVRMPLPGQLAATVARSCPEPADAAQAWSEVEQTERETPDTVRVVRLLLACDDADAEQHTDGDDRPATLTTSRIRGLLA